MPTDHFYTPAEHFRFRQGTKEENGRLAKPRSSADSEESEEQALLGGLRRYVEESDLSIPRLGELMGVSGAILSMWIAGTAKPPPMKLLEAKGFSMVANPCVSEPEGHQRSCEHPAGQV
jgi:hypothetical protein